MKIFSINHATGKEIQVLIFISILLQDDGFYSTVNAEIDWPEIGASGDLSKAMFSTWTSEIAHQTQSFQIHVIPYFIVTYRIFSMESIIHSDSIGKRSSFIFLVFVMTK